MSSDCGQRGVWTETTRVSSGGKEAQAISRHSSLGSPGASPSHLGQESDSSDQNGSCEEESKIEDAETGGLSLKSERKSYMVSVTKAVRQCAP